MRLYPVAWSIGRVAAYFSFGGGPRVCIGNDFATMEAMLLLAVLGQKYRFSLVEGTKVEPEPLITLHPKNLMMEIWKR